MLNEWGVASDLSVVLKKPMARMLPMTATTATTRITIATMRVVLDLADAAGYEGAMKDGGPYVG